MEWTRETLVCRDEMMDFEKQPDCMKDAVVLRERNQKTKTASYGPREEWRDTNVLTGVSTSDLFSPFDEGVFEKLGDGALNCNETGKVWQLEAPGWWASLWISQELRQRLPGVWLLEWLTVVFQIRFDSIVFPVLSFSILFVTLKKHFKVL